MKKAFFRAPIVILICILFDHSASFAGTTSLFQDTTIKKSRPPKGAEKDRTKGEAGHGQGRGYDTIRKSTGEGRQGNDSVINKNTPEKADQNSDNRGDGSRKDNRAGNKNEKTQRTDTTRH